VNKTTQPAVGRILVMEASCLMKFRMLLRYSPAGNDLERLLRALIMGMSPPRDNTHKLKRSRTTALGTRWRLWRGSSPPLPGPFFTVWAFYCFAALMPRTI
jgi:hypothetical protein